MIKARRAELDMTQQELADAIELSRGRIGHFEGGQPIPEKHIDKLAKVLKCSPASLRETIRYVRKADEVKEWKRLIYHDHETHEVIRTVLVWVADFMLDKKLAAKNIYRYSGSIASIVRNTPGVEHKELEEQWENLLMSGYVEKVSDTEASFDLIFPA